MTVLATIFVISSVIQVDAGGNVRSLRDAITRARAHDTIVVFAGTYNERASIVIDKPLTILGRPNAVLRGAGDHPLVIVRADSVTLRYLTLRNVQRSDTEDLAAVLLDSVSACVISDNVVEDAFFGIYAAGTTDCVISGNRVTGSGSGEQRNGNAIHMWSSRRLVVRGNTVEQYRDGIYMEFVTDSRIERNMSRRNRRFGLHFMFSHDCEYRDNTFRENGAGVAVMYTKRVAMTGNRFLRNQGPAAYGLVLKDITDSEIDGNTFQENSTALHMDGAARVRVTGNTFDNNGWAVRLLANAVATTLERNTFVRNAFDLATNSRLTSGTIRGNYWDSYTGYDLDRDGFGDVPHRPVRLFSLVVEQNPPALALQGSFLTMLIDFAERAFPVLTPGGLSDEAPRMRAGS